MSKTRIMLKSDWPTPSFRRTVDGRQLEFFKDRVTLVSDQELAALEVKDLGRALKLTDELPLADSEAEEVHAEASLAARRDSGGRLGAPSSPTRPFPAQQADESPAAAAPQRQDLPEQEDTALDPPAEQPPKEEQPVRPRRTRKSSRLAKGGRRKDEG